MRKWAPLVVLSAAQFLMVLDQSVMNVSISQLVDDFGTTVTVIQAVITTYALVMAMLMLTGGKIGDIWGRRTAFAVGLVIYAAGSALTAASWSVGSLLAGWSVLEGVGAALVMPALVALIASAYEGRDRVTAYGVIGGVAGAGIAVGPILGGWVTTNLTWRVVFVGEVVIAIAILASLGLISGARLEKRPTLDGVGSILSATGLGMIVLGILSASTWGWIAPRDSPVEVFGFSLTPFVVLGGFAVLYGFVVWTRRREEAGRDPLVHLRLFGNTRLRSGISTFLAQNTILLGVFFTVPLYLQIVQGLDAFETGVRMLPVSIAMFLTSSSGPKLAARWSPRTIVRAGFVVLVVAIVVLLSTIDPELDRFSFGLAMAVLGVGMGLIASQLGNVVQSSVGPKDRSEAGGLQWTSTQLGSALGTALIGAVVITGLGAAFVSNIESDDRVADAVTEEIRTELAGGYSFVSTDDVAAALDETDLDGETADAILEGYSDAQLSALKAGLLMAGAIAVLALMLTDGLPGHRPRPDTEGDDTEHDDTEGDDTRDDDAEDAGGNRHAVTADDTAGA